MLLAQLDLESVGTAVAIRRLEEATVSLPNDASLFFQLGFLRYRTGDFRGAVTALERVLILSPGNVNANASYFLGLSYAELGEKDKALGQFEIIARFNPDKTEINAIIKNIRAGRNPLSGLGVATISSDSGGPENTDSAAANGEESDL